MSKPAAPIRASLTLFIDGDEYRVHRIHAGPSVTSYRIARTASDAYTVTKSPGGMNCTCGDYIWRRSSAGQRCKHLIAAETCGLI